jgi:Zn ribbon nucleic-acid-binding protein
MICWVSMALDHLECCFCGFDDQISARTFNNSIIVSEKG